MSDQEPVKGVLYRYDGTRWVPDTEAVEDVADALLAAGYRDAYLWLRDRKFLIPTTQANARHQ